MPPSDARDDVGALSECYQLEASHQLVLVQSLQHGPNEVLVVISQGAGRGEAVEEVQELTGAEFIQLSHRQHPKMAEERRIVALEFGAAAGDLGELLWLCVRNLPKKLGHDELEEPRRPMPQACVATAKERQVLGIEIPQPTRIERGSNIVHELLVVHSQLREGAERQGDGLGRLAGKLSVELAAGLGPELCVVALGACLLCKPCCCHTERMSIARQAAGRMPQRRGSEHVQFAD
mmetsp:Transcript_609/g.1425  ORF Transcript_609/g.1425 Transcript_609/m.1425 type:complete len:235 (+) Transcript_609:813-1517(+)